MIRSAALLRSVLRGCEWKTPQTIIIYYSKTTIGRALGPSSSTFLNGSSAAYVDGMWARWKQDPESVHASWDTYFRAVDAGASPETAFVSAEEAAAAAITPGSGGGISSQHLEEATKLLHLIRAYQVRGHEHAALDPLGVAEMPDIPELSRTTYGWNEVASSPIVTATNFRELSGFVADADMDKDGKTTVEEVFQTLQKTYSSSIGVEYMHS